MCAFYTLSTHFIILWKPSTVHAVLILIARESQHFGFFFLMVKSRVYNRLADGGKIKLLKRILL